MSDDNTISTAEAAAVLSASRVTGNRLVHSGRLRGYRKTPARNSPMRVYRDSVLKFIKEKGGSYPRPSLRRDSRGQPPPSPPSCTFSTGYPGPGTVYENHLTGNQGAFRVFRLRSG